MVCLKSYAWWLNGESTTHVSWRIPEMEPRTCLRVTGQRPDRLTRLFDGPESRLTLWKIVGKM